MKSIRSRLIIYLLSILLAVGLGLSLVAYKEASNALEENTRDSLLELAEQGANIVIADYQAQLTKIQMIADRSRIQTMDWESQLPVLLEEIKRNGFLTMGVVNLDGYAQFVGKNDPVFLGDTSYVKTALAGTVNISDLIISPIDQSLVMMLAAPIYQDNTIAGVVIACRDGTALSDVVNNIKLGENGYAYLLNSQGNIVAHPNKDYVIQQHNFLEESRANKDLESLARIINRIISGKRILTVIKIPSKMKYM